MRTFTRWTAIVLTLLIPAGPRLWAGGTTGDDDSEVFFERQVRPVLAGTCVKCHGAVKASGGPAARLARGDAQGRRERPGGRAGRPEEQPADPGGPARGRVARDAAGQAAAGGVAGRPRRLGRRRGRSGRRPATTGRTRTIAGQKHWAFEPLGGIAPPDDPTGWAEGPIDRFIAAGLRAQRLHPVPQADRRTLIRRASFDLIGLPPTPERVEAFVADDRPDAYERLVDELLASPHYGERWGRYWLDLARYADTAGDNSDYPIPEAYLYRDYVIDAFNADIPYDRFLHEQLAGDILAADGPPEDYARRVIATGFVAQAKRFGTFKLEDIHQIIEDTLNTTGQVVLGLSLRCARCHDHKYDPITSRDYYALYGFFASTKYPFAGAEEEKKPSEFAPLIPPGEMKAGETKRAEQAARTKKASPKAALPVAYAVREGLPIDAKLQKGGNPHDLGPVVPAGCRHASTRALPCRSPRRRADGSSSPDG